MSKKENILRVALQLFGEQGFDRTTTSAVAREAGVSEGLIFRHFTNKAGLLAAIIQEGMAQIAATMQPYEASALAPRQAVLEHIERSLTRIREHEAFWRLATKIRFQTATQAVAGQQIEAINQFIIKHLAGNFAQLGAAQPELEALLLFAEIDGICLHWLHDPTGYPLEDMKKLLIQKYENR